MISSIRIFQRQRQQRVTVLASGFTFFVVAIALTIAAAIAPSAFAQVSSEAEKIQQIDQLLAATYKVTDRGAVVIIAKNGRPLLRKAYGLADIEKATLLKPEDVFRIGSVSKSFTAMAILLLEEEGKLSVKDQISQFLPNYPMQGHKITIEHLLTHTSGVAIYTDIPAVRDAITSKATPTEVIDLFKNTPMLRPPGE